MGSGGWDAGAVARPYLVRAEAPSGGAHREHHETIRRLEEAILRHLDEISDQDPEERKQSRFEKYMSIGRYAEEQQQTIGDQG